MPFDQDPFVEDVDLPGIRLEDNEASAPSSKVGLTRHVRENSGMGDAEIASFIEQHASKTLQKLGEGGYGDVFLVKHIKSGGGSQPYAMKVSKPGKKQKRIHAEKDILESCDNIFILTLQASFVHNSRMYFIEEYCEGGDFWHVLHRQPGKRLDEDQAAFYIAEVIVGLGYLHSLNFVYRDLKPENILLTSSGHVRLADFNMSKALGPDKAFGKARSNSKVGTTEYFAPEMIKDGGSHGVCLDWWTLGIFMFEILCGTTPFFTAKPGGKKLDEKETFKHISKGFFKFPDEVAGTGCSFCCSRGSNSAKNQGGGLMAGQDGASVPQVGVHGKAMIRALLVLDESKRLGRNGVEQVQAHPWLTGYLSRQEPPLTWDEVAVEKLTPPIVPVTKAKAGAI